MKNQLSDIDQYLYENPAIVNRFMVDNSDVFEAIKQRFKLYLDGNNVVARYLLARALNDIVMDELRTSKGQVKEQAFKQCGLVLMDAEDTKHGIN